MQYKHISEEERRIIEKLTQAGSSNKKIAEELGQSRSTIGRELKRNYGEGARYYEHMRAQKLSEKRRMGSKGPRIREKIWGKVFKLFKMDFSPKQVGSVIKVSHESIYRRIYAEIKVGRLDRKHLRWNLQKRLPRDLSKNSIENRPDLSSRAEFGHWEGDTVELVRGQSYLVTLVERKTRFLATKLIPNKKSETVRKPFYRHLSHFLRP